jgi:hypothetical protein
VIGGGFGDVQRVIVGIVVIVDDVFEVIIVFDTNARVAEDGVTRKIVLAVGLLLTENAFGFGLDAGCRS